MPLCSPPIPRSALILLLSGSLLLGGCSSLGDLWPWGKEKKQQEEVILVLDEETPKAAPDAGAQVEPEAVESGAEAAVPAQDGEGAPELGVVPEVLQFWESIRGGLTGDTGFLSDTLDTVTGGNYIQFVRPVAVAVRGDYLYVVDDGLELVMRYDRITGRIKVLLELRGLTAGEVSDIYVAKDYTFYITDTFGSKVYHFSAKGRLMRTFQNKLNMSKPVAIAEDENTGYLFIADGEFDHILVYNPQGELVSALGGRGAEPGEFLNITAMARGLDGFYTAARVGQRVQVLNEDGFYLYSLEQEGIVFPLAITTGDDFRVFVSDYMDNTIKVYERGKLTQIFGGTGVAPGKFKRISDMWFDNGLLYAADSLNGRIQVIKLTAEAPPENTGEH